MAVRKTPISKKSAKKVVEEEMVDEEQEAPPKKGGKKKAVVEADDADADSPKKREVSSAVSKELLDKVYEILKAGKTVNTSKKDIKAICDCFVKTLVAQVVNGDKVTLTNHMTFKRAARKERKHITPRTGVEVTKPAHYVMAMEVKPALKTQLESIKVNPADLLPKKAAKEAKPAVAAAAAKAKKAKK